jgi:hypothetical protein
MTIKDGNLKAKVGYWLRFYDFGQEQRVWSDDGPPQQAGRIQWASWPGTDGERRMSENDGQPKSLGGYRVPQEREALVKAHIASLSETARQVSDQLAFGADISDVAAVLDANADDDNRGGQ